MSEETAVNIMLLLVCVGFLSVVFCIAGAIEWVISNYRDAKKYRRYIANEPGETPEFLRKQAE